MNRVEVDHVFINYESSGTGKNVALCLPGALGECTTAILYG